MKNFPHDLLSLWRLSTDEPNQALVSDAVDAFADAGVPGLLLFVDGEWPGDSFTANAPFAFAFLACTTEGVPCGVLTLHIRAENSEWEENTKDVWHRTGNVDVLEMLSKRQVDEATAARLIGDFVRAVTHDGDLQLKLVCDCASDFARLRLLLDKHNERALVRNYDCQHYESQIQLLQYLVPEMSSRIRDAQQAGWYLGWRRHHPLSDCFDNYCQFLAMREVAAALRNKLLPVCSAPM